MFVYGEAKVKYPFGAQAESTGLRRSAAMKRPGIQISIAAVLLALAVLAGCGGSGSSDTATTATIPGDGNTADVKVIGAWVDALRAGEVDQAASYFALPSVVQNGTPPVRLKTRDDVVSFNSSLPCGAKLVSASSNGQVTTATFELTDRPGGSCGAGVGQVASTAFVIEDGLIVHWARVANSSSPAEGGTSGQLS
jgi:hypothetical protein